MMNDEKVPFLEDSTDEINVTSLSSSTDISPIQTTTIATNTSQPMDYTSSNDEESEKSNDNESTNMQSEHMSKMSNNNINNSNISNNQQLTNEEHPEVIIEDDDDATKLSMTQQITETQNIIDAIKKLAELDLDDKKNEEKSFLELNERLKEQLNNGCVSREQINELENLRIIIPNKEYDNKSTMASNLNELKINSVVNVPSIVDNVEQVSYEESLPTELQVELPSFWVDNDKTTSQFQKEVKTMKVPGHGTLRISSGECLTLRVPTHNNGEMVECEFMSEGYDIAFGLFFELSKPLSNQVQMIRSEDEEDEEEEEEETYEDDAVHNEHFPHHSTIKGDDRGNFVKVDNVDPERRRVKNWNEPPTMELIPLYRRDTHVEVFSFAHTYPCEGVYLIKFDNTYSIWRSKTINYRLTYHQMTTQKYLLNMLNRGSNISLIWPEDEMANDENDNNLENIDENTRKLDDDASNMI
ncbi:hypothetical protein SNEBB_008138 [Seison nebaliae]|nr:hypothetical protein SNEBB_008138 [Seison nebaliae]